MDDKIRGRRAAELMADPVLLEAFDTVEKAYVQRMIATDPGDNAGRARFHGLIHSLVDLRNTLTIFAQTGTIEEINAERREKVKTDAERNTDK